MALFGLFNKKKKEALDQGLEKTKTNFFSKLGKAVAGKSKVDEEVLDNLEELLIASDVGVDTTLKIIERIEARVKKDKYLGIKELGGLLKEEISFLLQENASNDVNEFQVEFDTKPYVMMVVGVNGVGKTTTIGKLAAQYKKAGKKVVLGAADTFRAAAVEQLKLWGERVDVPVIELGMGKEPSTVVFEASKKAVEMGADILIIDTAGRLHNKVHLMNELTKMKRTIQKFIATAPHEVLLVLDGSTGQNAAMQAREFTKSTEVTSLAITKLDGTAKGGVVIGISDEFKIPVKYIGVGEQIDDLQLFNRTEFVDSLFKDTDSIFS